MTTQTFNCSSFLWSSGSSALFRFIWWIHLLLSRNKQRLSECHWPSKLTWKVMEETWLSVMLPCCLIVMKRELQVSRLHNSVPPALINYESSTPSGTSSYIVPRWDKNVRSLHAICSFGQWECDWFRQSLCQEHSVPYSVHELMLLEQPPPLFFCLLVLEGTDKALEVHRIWLSHPTPRRRIMPRRFRVVSFHDFRLYFFFFLKLYSYF